MKFWQFIKTYWYIPFLIVGSILAWIVFRQRTNPVAYTKRELEAIDAGRRARELEAKLGIQRAKIQILAQYTEEIGALDEKQKVKAKELGDNPQALAKFLVKAGRR